MYLNSSGCHPRHRRRRRVSKSAVQELRSKGKPSTMNSTKFVWWRQEVCRTPATNALETKKVFANVAEHLPKETDGVQEQIKAVSILLDAMILSDPTFRVIPRTQNEQGEMSRHHRRRCVSGLRYPTFIFRRAPILQAKSD
jgi:hypothetical protein